MQLKLLLLELQLEFFLGLERGLLNLVGGAVVHALQDGARGNLVFERGHYVPLLVLRRQCTRTLQIDRGSHRLKHLSGFLFEFGLVLLLFFSRLLRAALFVLLFLVPLLLIRFVWSLALVGLVLLLCLLRRDGTRIAFNFCLAIITVLAHIRYLVGAPACFV